MKKVSEKTLSVLLTLLILLPLVISVVPISLNSLLVKAASSAAITLDISDGYVGDYITVNGSGFTPNKDVTFMWGDKLFNSLGFIVSPGYQRPSIQRSASPAQVHTDALGNFKVQLQVPKLTSGTYTIKADDTVTSATSSFTINPLIKLVNEYAYETHGEVQTPSDNPSSVYYIDLFLTEGFVNDRLGIQLSGFGRGETVEVKMGTTHIGDAADFIVGSSGTTEGYWFETAAARVPNILGGTYTVTATGTVSAITASTTFTINPELFLGIPWTPPTDPPPASLSLGVSWVNVYSEVGGTLGYGWYTSVGTASASPFVFEATGLTGTSISSVSIVYSGISPMSITPTGTLSLQANTGATQGISASTVPFTSSSPFGATSPVARTTASLGGGQMINVTITTSGTGAASFTFTKQLFSSAPSTSDTEGTLVWVEGDSTIASDGTSLSGFVSEPNKLAITGLKASASSLYPAVVYATGSTVQEWDFDVLYGYSLTLYDQDVTPVSFYDAVANSAWDVDETVYVDNDNSGTVTTGDSRVTVLTLGGTTYWPWSTVGAADPDVSRVVVEFAKSTRPALYLSAPYRLVYLDKNADSTVSKGDTRISTFLPSWGGTTADLNGFVASTLLIPVNLAGGGLQYNVGLWNLGVGSYGVKAGNTVTMTIMPKITITAPTSYQSTQYVTEGSSVTVAGNGFFGAESVTISAGGKYITTPTAPSAFGVLSSTTITMPALAGGEQTITVQGMFTTDNTASANVTYTPALRVSPTTGYNLNPVTAISVRGIGFEAGTYQIVFDGAGIGQAVTSAFTVADTGDFAGQINIAFNLPEGVEGAHIVDVVKTSDTTESAFYGASYFYYSGGWTLRTGAPFPTNSEFPTVTIYPSIQIVPTEAIVGSNVTVTGKGLQPSTTYYIWYDPRGTSTSQAVLMTTTPTTVTTDTKGNLTASFQIPQSSGGTRNIWVSTSNTSINNDPVLGSQVSTSVYINPAITLSSSSGVVGASINVSFTGLSYGTQYQLWWYKPQEAKEDIWWGVVQVPQTAILLETLTGALYGNSSSAVSFTVPATAETGTVYSVDLTSYGSRYSVLANPVSFTVGKVATMITLSCTPSTVTQGENVTINGVITPALSVSITLFIKDPEGTSTNKTITSTSSGTFTDTFKANKAGTWQVTAKWDGDSTFAAYTSLAATATVKPFDISSTLAVAGLVIGAIALVIGLIALSYFGRKKRVAPPT